MHILLVHQFFLESDGGGGSRFNEMTRLWAEAGHEVTVIAGMVHYGTGRKPAQYRGRFIARENYLPNVTVYRCHVSESYNRSFVGRLLAYFSFVLSSTICGLFSCRRRYDAVLVTSPPLFVALTGIVLSALKRIPFVFEVRDLWPESAIDTGVLTNPTLIKLSYWLEALTYRRALAVNVLTPAFRNALVQRKGVPEGKVMFIPNAADFSIVDSVMPEFDRDAFREKLGLDGRVAIIYVGAHGVANHLTQVLDTAELLRDTNATFLLVGDGMEKPKLVAEAQRRGLANVMFIDPVPKRTVFEYILASDIGTSVLKRCDTFKTVYSNKTFDYMSCSKPILMAIDGVSRELVEQAECGLFVEPENPKDFAEKARYYIEHPEEAKRHGENGCRYARAEFDRGVLGERYVAELETRVGAEAKSAYGGS
jgi:glycosyltransferase involved in cell wall biosynthesis